VKIGRLWVILLFLALAMPLMALPEDVGTPVVAPASGTTLVLPPQTRVQGVYLARSEVQRFQDFWETFFGRRFTFPDTLVIPPSPNLAEAVFDTLWRQAAINLRPGEESSVRVALRRALLGDPNALVAELESLSRNHRLDLEPYRNPLLYCFLQDEVSDKTFLTRALPPGPNAANLKQALEERGVSWDAFCNRFATWILKQAIELRKIQASPGTLPAVWVLDSDLSPGAFMGWRFPASDPVTAVDAQLAGDAQPGIRMICLYTDNAGRVVHCSVNTPGADVMLFPREGATLWAFIWNASDQDTGNGLTLTFWKDYDLPFQVKEAYKNDATLDLSLVESAGIADYQIFARTRTGGAFSQVDTPPFLSEGEGLHHYRLTLPPSLSASSEYQISCRTLAGGTYSAPFKPEDAEP
jgi:hypothetical protein